MVWTVGFGLNPFLRHHLPSELLSKMTTALLDRTGTAEATDPPLPT